MLVYQCLTTDLSVGANAMGYNARSKLQAVRQIRASGAAFAALLQNGAGGSPKSGISMGCSRDLNPMLIYVNGRYIYYIINVYIIYDI